MADAFEKNLDQEVPLEKKLEDLYDLIDGIETAMLTTRRPDGTLVSDEVSTDPHVNVSYYRDRTREWVSVSGKAVISRDRQLIRGLYQPDWKAWLGAPGGAQDGGPEDPRIALILVTAEAVTYSKKDRPMPVVLFNIVKAMITGEPPKVADLREVSADELRKAPKLQPDLRA